MNHEQTITAEDTHPLMDACIEFTNYKSEITEQAILIFMNEMEISQKKLIKDGIRKIYTQDNTEEYYYHDILIIRLKLVFTDTGAHLDIKAPTFVTRKLEPFIEKKRSTPLKDVQTNSLASTAANNGNGGETMSGIIEKCEEWYMDEFGDIYCAKFKFTCRGNRKECTIEKNERTKINDELIKEELRKELTEAEKEIKSLKLQIKRLET